MCREPWASTTVDNTPWIPKDVHRSLEIHLLDEEDAFGTLCPAGPTGAPHTWQVSQDLYNDMVAFIPSFEPLQMIYRHLRLTRRPIRSLMCPYTHWEPRKFIVWRKRGHPIFHHFGGSYSSLWHLWTSSGLLEGPTTCIDYYLTS